MAKTDITHTCGHTTTADIVGPSKDRPRIAEYLASKPCRDCAITAQNAAAAESNVGLPALVGSEKQIAWAETLRAKMVAAINEDLDRMELGEAHIAIAREVNFNALATITDCRVWIDKLRHANVDTFITVAFGSDDAYEAALTEAGVQ